MRPATQMHDVLAVGLTLGWMTLIGAGASAQAPKIGDPPEAKNMRLVGFNDLARCAARISRSFTGKAIATSRISATTAARSRCPSRSIRSPSQAEFNGTSIVDVTDPKQPKYLAHIPAQEGLGEQGGAQMVRACDGKSLPKGDPSKTYLLRTFGSQGHEMWDVTKPESPSLITRVSWNLKDTHKSWWECDTGIAYLVSGVDGWRMRRMTEVFDLSDPTKPVKIRDFGLAGQQPGATGAVPTELHGMISTGPRGNRIYFGYGTNKGGVLQIVDREKLLKGPKEPTPENLRYPVIGELDMTPLNGAHSTIPLGKMKIPEFGKDLAGAERDMVMIVDESLVNECQAAETRQMVWFVDATIEAQTHGGVELQRARGGRPFLHAAAAASARIPRTRAWRRCSIRSSRSSPGSMPACAPSTSAIPTARRRPATSSRQSPRPPTSVASRSMARTAARPRSRATMSKPTTAATSMSSIAPIPACTFWS